VHHFEQFIRSRQFLKNVTPKTLDWYATSFAALRKHHPTEEFTKASLEGFVIRLRENCLSPVSCNTYCRAINAYLRWLQEEGYLDLLLRIPSLKCERKVLPALSPAQLRAVLNYRPRHLSHQRLYALLCLLLDSGLRIEEALSLTRMWTLKTCSSPSRGKARSTGLYQCHWSFGRCCFGGWQNMITRCCFRRETE
jgi:site-specific recombinase XerD